MNIPNPTQYEYGPTIVLEDGVFYAFYCANGLPNLGWDTIRTTSSTDGINWGSPTVALQPSNKYDTESVCDPSLVKFHGVYFLYHTCISNNSPDGYQNNRICVAMADSIQGPYAKYEEAVVQDLSCSPTDISLYCIGQPSAVVYNDMVYLFFSFVNASNLPGPNPGYIYLAVSPDGVNFKWANNANPVFLQRDVDVKYERSSNMFFLVQGDVGDTHITWSVSPNGINWMPYNLSHTLATNPQLPSGGSNNNPGLAGLPDGSFSGMTFASFGSSYQVGWGDWHLYRTNIIVNPVQNNCSACVATSCDLGCSGALKVTAEGYCAMPGSTNGGDCCSCSVPIPVPDCSGCASGCVAACMGAGFNTGICGAPGSVDPAACCSCFN